MTLKPMPKGVVGDQNTKLVSPFTAGIDNKVYVADSGVIPAATTEAPNYASIRMPNKSCLVTFRYTGVDGNTITGVQVVESDVAIGMTATYPVGSKVYWSLANVELSSIIDNIYEIAGSSGVGHASKDVYGIVRIGDGIKVEDGVISAENDANDYNSLINKPKIDGHELIGDVQSEDIGIVKAEEGKGLSANDFTDELKAKLDGIDVAAAITAHNTDTSAHPYWAARIENKVDKVPGYHLSQCNYSEDEQDKLSDIERGAQRNLLDFITANGDIINPVPHPTTGRNWVHIPAASITKFGVVKIGSGLKSEDGVISVEGGTGTTDYNQLLNKPQINGTELSGNKSLLELDIASNSALSSEQSQRISKDLEIEGNVNNHKSDLNNPHNVTKAQLGLDNVDNTSDLEKPISTAAQTQLDLKLPKYQGIEYAGLYLAVGSDGLVTYKSGGGGGGSAVWGGITGNILAQTDLIAKFGEKLSDYQGTDKAGKYFMVDSTGNTSFVSLHPTAGTGSEEGTLIFSDGQASVEGGTLVL